MNSLQKPITYGWYGPFYVRELVTGDLQIAISEEDRVAFREEVDANEYEYPSFEEVIYKMIDGYIDASWGKPLFYYDTEGAEPTLYLGDKEWFFCSIDHPCEFLAERGYIEFERSAS